MKGKNKIVSVLNLILFLSSFILFSANTIRLGALYAPVDIHHVCIKAGNTSDLAITRQQVSEQNENESGKELGTKLPAYMPGANFVCISPQTVSYARTSLKSYSPVNSISVYLMVRNFRI